MKADYLHFRNGQKFRVEANWNSFETFCEVTGRVDLSALENLKDIKLREAPVLLWSCLKEGEEIDGRKFDMTIKDLKRQLNPQIIGEFFKIYTKQTYAQLPDEYKKSKKK